MLDLSLRPIKADLLRPLTKRLPTVPPAALTGLGLIIGLMSALALVLHAPTLAIVLWLLNRLLDGLDGEVARLTDRQSDLGGYLDTLADYVIYAALPLALAWHSSEPFAWPSVALLISSFYINAASWMYLSALLEKRSVKREQATSITMPTGLIEGTETILFFTTMLLFPAVFVPIAQVMALLVVATIIQRLAWARVHLRGHI